MSGPHQGADFNWTPILQEGSRTQARSTADAQLAVLMDIRHELKRMNEVLHCTNFLAIPSKLDSIQRNTTKKKRKGGVK